MVRQVIMNYWTKSVWVPFLLVLICDQFLCTQGVESLEKTKRNPWWHKPTTCTNSMPVDSRHYVNTWDGRFAFQCKSRSQSITSVYSVYKTCKRDRVWSFTCGKNRAAKDNCHWSSHFVNDYDKPLDFKCPNEGFITGILSEHVNRFEDRRFNFRCCNHRNYIHYKCTETHDINTWRGIIDFQVRREGKRFYLVGASSHHDNRQEDRLWKFKVCKLRFRRGHK